MQYRNTLKELFGADTMGKIHHLSGYLYGEKWHVEDFRRLSSGRRCFLFGTANYPNLGDLAITEAQLGFLSTIFGMNNILEIQTDHMWEYIKGIKRCINDNDVICMQGGGNMGDLYSHLEYERCAVIKTFPNNRCIIFPQTISYSSPDSSTLRYSQKVYRQHRDLHLFAREAQSKAMMKQLYPSCDVQLTPDIVLTLDVNRYLNNTHYKRTVLTLLLRDDAERSLTKEDWQIILSTAMHTGLTINKRDTVFPYREINIPERRKMLSEMLKQIAESQVVITDRLHGMIFAAITETPCVVLSNSNHKIAGVYQWIRELPYIAFVQTSAQVEGALQRVLNARARYPREQISEAFNPLRKILND